MEHRKQYRNCRTSQTYQFTIADEHTQTATVITIGPDYDDGEPRNNRFHVEIDLAPRHTLKEREVGS